MQASQLTLNSQSDSGIFPEKNINLSLKYQQKCILVTDFELSLFINSLHTRKKSEFLQNHVKPILPEMLRDELLLSFAPLIFS